MKVTVILIMGSVLLCGATASAQQAAQAADAGSNLTKGLIAIGMALAVGLGALATAIAQARIGPAAVGSVVEKPESLGVTLIFFLLPETLVIFGLVIAFILFGKL